MVSLNFIYKQCLRLGILGGEGALGFAKNTLTEVSRERTSTFVLDSFAVGGEGSGCVSTGYLCKAVGLETGLTCAYYAISLCSEKIRFTTAVIAAVAGGTAVAASAANSVQKSRSSTGQESRVSTGGT